MGMHTKHAASKDAASNRQGWRGFALALSLAMLMLPVGALQRGHAQTVALNICQAQVGPPSSNFVSGCSCSGGTLTTTFTAGPNDTAPGHPFCQAGAGIPEQDAGATYSLRQTTQGASTQQWTAYLPPSVTRRSLPVEQRLANVRAELVRARNQRQALLRFLREQKAFENQLIEEAIQISPQERQSALEGAGLEDASQADQDAYINLLRARAAQSAAENNEDSLRNHQDSLSGLEGRIIELQRLEDLLDPDGPANGFASMRPDHETRAHHHATSQIFSDGMPGAAQRGDQDSGNSLHALGFLQSGPGFLAPRQSVVRSADGQWAAWVGAGLSLSDDERGLSSTQTNSASLTTGLSYQWNDQLTVGAQLRYRGIDSERANASQSSDTRGLGASLFAQYQSALGAIITPILAYERTRTDITEQIAGVAQTGSFNSDLWTLGAQVSQRMDLHTLPSGSVLWAQPDVALSYIITRRQAYLRSDGLRIGSDQSTQGDLRLGGQLGMQLSPATLPGHIFEPYIGLHGSWAFSGNGDQVLSDGSLIKADALAASLSAGASMTFPGGAQASAELSYSGVGSHARTIGANARFSIPLGH